VSRASRACSVPGSAFGVDRHEVRDDGLDMIASDLLRRARSGFGRGLCPAGSFPLAISTRASSASSRALASPIASGPIVRFRAFPPKR